MTKLIQITDTHLSPTHGFFYANVARTLALINQAQTDMLVITGDLSINGPDVEDDLRFSRWCLQLAQPPARFLPGNHDVGEEPGAEHLGQGITWDRLAAYRRLFGTDFWVQDIDAWRLIGLNTQLFGSGFDAEAAQWMLLENALAGAGERPCGLFMHKPLFLESPDEAAEPTKAVLPTARRALIRLLQDHPVKFIASGHLHQYRQMNWNGIRLIWAPSCAFSTSNPRPGCDARLGYLEFEFAGKDFSVMPVFPEELDPIDLDTIKQHGRYEFLMNVPPVPAAVASRWRAEEAEHQL